MGLLNEIDQGEVVLPAIQRDFVWNPEQTSTLLDSVMRGYPLGIVLLWETYNDIQYRTFVKDFRSGTVHSFDDNGRQKRLKVVLDGQQRLQSLYLALRGQRDGKSTYFDVLSGQTSDETSEDRFVFELLDVRDATRRNTEAGQSSTASDDPESRPSWWMKASELFAMGLNERAQFARRAGKKLALSDDELLRLEMNLSWFHERLSSDSNILLASTIDKSLPQESPDRKSEADVLEIFVRVNTEGTPLSRSDLIFSLLKLNWRESAEGLPEFVASINEGNSFELDTDFVIRCLFAVSGLGGRLDLDLLRKRQNVEKLQDNFAAML